MAYTERDILGNIGALRVALITLATSPDSPPKNEAEASQWHETQKNMKDTIAQSSELLLGGAFNDLNRIANALEETVRMKHEHMELIRLDYENRGVKK